MLRIFSFPNTSLVAAIMLAAFIAFVFLAAPESVFAEELQIKKDVLSPSNPEEKPKSAAEILSELEEISKQNDSEEIEEVVEEESSEKSNDPDLDEFLQASEGTDTENAVEIDEADGQSADSQKDDKRSDEFVGRFEKVSPLEISLITDGNPEEELNEFSEMQKITGRLVPERRRIGRRSYVYRWVLKGEDGSRIPLKSNLKLLSEVKKEDLLDGYVALTGKFIESGFANELRYFMVESVVAMEALPEPAAAE